jgi:hypothetical protein
MSQKLKVAIGISTVLLSLVGCGNSETNQTKTVVVTTTTETPKATETKKPSKEVKKSCAEKHPELDEQLVTMFALDKEYSDDASDFFGLTGESKDYSVENRLMLHSIKSERDFIDFYSRIHDDKGELQKKLVIQVEGSKDVSLDDETEDHYKLDQVRIRYKVVQNEADELKSINKDIEKWKGTEYDVTTDAHDFFKELASSFDKVLVYTEETVSGKRYILYKYIPLSEGYQLEVRLMSNKNTIGENLEEIKLLWKT